MSVENKPQLKNLVLSASLFMFVVFIGSGWLCVVCAKGEMVDIPDNILYAGAFLVTAVSGVNVAEVVKKPYKFGGRR